MSRTYRRDAIDLNRNDKPLPYDVMIWDSDDYVYGETNGVDYYSKWNKRSDSKPWHKSPGWYKKMMGKARRAKVRNVMTHAEYDNIPRFRKTNDWEWS